LLLTSVSAVLFVMAVAVFSISPAAQGSGDRPALAITGSTLVDVHTGRTVHDTTILIAGDRIRHVGSSQDIHVPEGTRVLDARGRWIVPGLIDMHVHVSTMPDVPLELYVANGVTAIRDLGGNLTALRMLREAPQDPDRPRPRLFFVGAILDGAAPSAPRISIIVDTPKRATSAVGFLIDQGVDAIKVYNGVSNAALSAIVSAAAAKALPVVGHVPRAITAARAAQLGLNGIEHSAVRAVDLQEWGLLSPEDADRIRATTSVTQREAAVWERLPLDAAPLRALIAHLAKSRIFLDPTLSTDEYATLFLYDQQAEHANNRYLKRSFVELNLGPEHDVFRVPSEMRALAEAGMEKRRKFVGMSHRSGVTIVAGTDGPGIGTMAPGFGLHRELALLVEAGLAPLDALRAATINAARALGHHRTLGAVEAGKFADIVVLAANPLEDIRNTQRIESVIVDGRILQRAALETLLSDIEAAAKANR
jgi:Amidohydrolase family